MAVGADLDVCMDVDRDDLVTREASLRHGPGPGRP
jgi:hypothetical protein